MKTDQNENLNALGRKLRKARKVNGVCLTQPKNNNKVMNFENYPDKILNQKENFHNIIT